jgi:prepilin-type N-terminal cleavage/methylation domain-containing protein
MRRMKGFTLVEIMIVVAIIGLLVAIGVPGFIKARDNARKNTCYNNLRLIAHAVQQRTIDENIASGSDVPIYDDVIMPATADTMNNELYIPRYLQCPEGADDTGATAYGGDGTAGADVNNNSLNVGCAGTGTVTHGSYPDLI